PSVDDLAHVRAAWVRENAAIAERARAPLLAALEPSNDPAAGDLIGRPGIECLLVSPRTPCAACVFEVCAPAIEGTRHVALAEFRTPVPMLHHEFPGPSGRIVPRVECRAECGPVIACRRLDEHVVESRVFSDLPVCDAVHRAAAR